jgi:hypothetical protein
VEAEIAAWRELATSDDFAEVACTGSVSCRNLAGTQRL